MSDLICPHCKTTVPHGASVCTGCHAELEYGTPPFLLGAILLGAIILGLYVGNGMNGGGLVGTVAGVVAFAALFAWLNKAFRDRVVFKRIYRTGAR
ncbi:hypothetical protein P3T17_000176 [Paraburkholderia sp. GAS82]|jgi:hypothetical protein